MRSGGRRSILPTTRGRICPMRLQCGRQQDADVLLPMLSSTMRQIDLSIGLSDAAPMKGRSESSPAPYLHRSAA
jgi:hypothetical protein